MAMPFRIHAAARISAYITPDAVELIQSIEKAAKRHGMVRPVSPNPNPRKFVKNTDDAKEYETVKKELERMGFKFSKLAIHRPTTLAVEADGMYKNVHYILDVVFNDNQLEVVLYY